MADSETSPAKHAVGIRNQIDLHDLISEKDKSKWWLSLTCMYYMFVLFYFSTLQSQVKPVLEKLKTDVDTDVQYYAIEALECKLYSFISTSFQN